MSAVVGNITDSPSTAQAFNRFGFGGRPDDALPASPMNWLAAQITCADPMLTGQTVQQALALYYAVATAPIGSTQRATVTAQALNNAQGEANAFLHNAVTTQIPFRERLVWFWSNHYAVMAAHGMATLLSAAPFVREAVRANMTGTVAQMLQAAILHPAMLNSLTAQSSIGPQSAVGLGAARHGIMLNINENLGRETLELYTLGYNQGYTQADVDALSTLLSGLDVNVGPNAPLGTFYNISKQQPGNVTLMGTTYPCTQAGLASALQMLGTHPNTYRHLAAKLVTHFVSDTPPPADIAVVANALATSGGSLAAAHRAVIGLQNAWIPSQKLKAPAELIVSTLRAVGASGATMPVNIYGYVQMLGQPTWQPDFPDGWSDLASDWNGPAAVMIRYDWLWRYSAIASYASPQQTLAATVAPFLSARTRAAIATAPTAQQCLGLLLCSPEFQRR